MRTLLATFLCLLTLACSKGEAQQGSPLTESSDGSRYVNAYFGLEVVKPAGWYAQDPEATMAMSARGVNMMAGDSKGMKALLDVPVRGEVRQGRYRPEPGPHTDAIIQKMAEPQNSDIVSKLFIGINPKGSVTEGLTRSNIGNMPQAAGVTSLAVGDKAGYIASVFQTAAYFLAPTLHANGELICRDGRFLALDSPEIRSIAARYGDPDQLLSQLP